MAERADWDLSSSVFMGPYQLISEVGLGAVARVLRARHIHPLYEDRFFAVKILHDELSRDMHIRRLFFEEAFVLANLRHPNIVQTSESSLQDGRLYLGMEYVAGRDLDVFIQGCQQAGISLPLGVGLHIIGQVLSGLSYAHDLSDAQGQRLGLVHQDLNPANVFISYDGAVKIGDFGIAKITAGRSLMVREIAGKAGYFAPEQIAGEEVDQRADLFAVGIMLFEVLSGARLFAGDTLDELLRANRRGKIPNLKKLNQSLDQALVDITMHALSKKRDKRFASAREFHAALAPYLPNPEAMALAVASLMRQTFLKTYLEELALTESLLGVPHPMPQVSFWELEPVTEQAFTRLAQDNGLVVVPSDTVPDPHHVWVTELGRTPHGPRPAGGSLVVISDSYTQERMQEARMLGAHDLLVQPFSAKRAVNALTYAASPLARISEVTPSLNEVAPQRRILVASSRRELVAMVETLMADATVVLVQSVQDVARQLSLATAHALVCDLIDQPAHALALAEHCFAQPGMGPIATVLVCTDVAAPLEHTLAAPTLLLAWDQLEDRLAQGLSTLWAEALHARSFTRYPCSIPGQLRHSGRVFDGTIFNISRGGIGMRCAQMPPVHSQVGLSWSLAGGSLAGDLVEATGTIERIEEPMTEERPAAVAIRFVRFRGQCEARVISWISAQ